MSLELKACFMQQLLTWESNLINLMAIRPAKTIRESTNIITQKSVPRQQIKAESTSITTVRQVDTEKFVNLTDAVNIFSCSISVFFCHFHIPLHFYFLLLLWLQYQESKQWDSLLTSWWLLRWGRPRWYCNRFLIEQSVLGPGRGHYVAFSVGQDNLTLTVPLSTHGYKWYSIPPRGE